MRIARRKREPYQQFKEQKCMGFLLEANVLTDLTMAKPLSIP